MKRRDFLRLAAGATAGAATMSVAALPWRHRARLAPAPVPAPAPTPGAPTDPVTKAYFITDGMITQPDGVAVYFKGYSSSDSVLEVPTQPFTVEEGAAVSIDITNTLSEPHAFHIDDVVDSGPIASGQKVTVQFTAPRAGSYFFYDNLNAPYHRLLGLHGMIAVMPAGLTDQLYAGSPRFAQQYFWVFNDIDPHWNAALATGATPTTPYTPRYFTLNGQSSRPPKAKGYGDPAIDAMANPNTRLHGSVGDRALIRVFNAGMANQSIHWHGNHVEWLTANRQVRPAIWRKDVVPLRNQMGSVDVIYPFEAPPDACPPVTSGMYPMHLHNEMTQTAGGGLYLFGAMTDIHFE